MFFAPKEDCVIELDGGGIHQMRRLSPWLIVFVNLTISVSL